MRVLVYSAVLNDGCAFYRGMGPWSALAKRNRDFDVLYCQQKVAWGEVRQSDILFLLRPCQDELREAVVAAKDFGVKLWVDFDDDLLALPTDNPGHPYYSAPRIMQNIEYYLKSADLVTCSTEPLKEALSKHNPNVKVVENAFDTDLLNWPANPTPSNNFVLWRGTKTHDRDVASVSAQIVEASKEFPAYTFVFFGSDPVPYQCSEKIDRVLRVPATNNVGTFLKTLVALKPAIVISPLYDCVFNRSKSCIAAIEAAFAGAACIGPDWDEWRIPGVINYKDPENFGVLLKSYLASTSAPERKAKETKEYISTVRTLTAANEKRIALARELVGT